MTVSISSAEFIALNDFVKALGCVTCASVIAPETLCQMSHVTCEAANVECHWHIKAA